MCDSVRLLFFFFFFGPLLERGIDPSLGWELVKAATHPQTCAFGVLGGNPRPCAELQPKNRNSPFPAIRLIYLI